MFLGGSSHALRGVRIAGAGTNVWGRELEAGAAYALAFVNNGDATVAVTALAAMPSGWRGRGSGAKVQRTGHRRGSGMA